MPEKPKLLMVTAVWGEWHIAALQELNLPTLLADGNLPALAEYCDIHYIIYTSKQDRSRLSSAHITRLLSPIVDLELRLLDDEVLKNPIAAHHKAWTQAIEQAKKANSLVLLMPPDVAWADNAFRSVGQRLHEGYRAILMTYLRAEEESFAAALRAEPRTPDGRRAIAANRMVELCIDSLHPLMAAHMVDAEYFAIHPEMIIWPVAGEGLMLRILAREMFLFDPNRVQLNQVQLPSEPLRPGEGCFISDSDELFAVSLAPLGKDAAWHNVPRTADPVEIGGWWLAYDSAVNDFIVSHRLRWHFRPVTEAKWRQVERRSDLFIRRCAAAREGIRFWQAARRLGIPTAAKLLAVAVHTDVMRRALAGRSAAIVVMPTEPAMAALRPDQIDRLCTPAGARALIELIRHHIFPMSDELVWQTDPLSHCHDAGRSSIAGPWGDRRLERSPHGTLLLDDAPIRCPPLTVGNHKLYIADDLLIDAEALDRILDDTTRPVVRHSASRQVA